MDTRQFLTQWKTDAWKDPSMVAWYSGRMVENSGTNRLNNLLEVGLCDRYASGHSILDIGVGTGRASLPLARKGKSLTGIDSSQAMLDECKRLAGDVPVTLQVGDILNLPVQDEAYDTAMALNVMTHFPHWREVMAHWVSKVKPGGRLIFDVYSLDHLRAATGKFITEEELVPAQGDQVGARAFNLRISAVDAVKNAEALGLSVVDIIPYRAFFGSTDTNRLLAPSLDGPYRWERFLSWMAKDEALLNFSYWLESSLVANLSSVVTGKMMLVFEKTPAPEKNMAWLQRNEQINTCLRQKISFESLASFVTVSQSVFKDTVHRYFSHHRVRYLLFRILLPLLQHERIDIGSFMHAEDYSVLLNWVRKERLDNLTMSATRFYDSVSEKDGFTLNQVNALMPLEYELTRRMLVNYFGEFKGEKE